jgi:hypothetical protein
MLSCSTMQSKFIKKKTLALALIPGFHYAFLICSAPVRGFSRVLFCAGYSRTPAIIGNYYAYSLSRREDIDELVEDALTYPAINSPHCR